MKYLFFLITFISLLHSCTTPDERKDAIRIGASDGFKKENNEYLIPYDTNSQKPISYFNQLGKIQIPTNKILKGTNYNIYINIALYDNKEVVVNALEKQKQFSILSKNNDSFFLKNDTLYCSRNIYAKKDYLYLVDFISNDSVKVAHTHNSGNLLKRFQTKGF